MKQLKFKQTQVLLGMRGKQRDADMKARFSLGWLGCRWFVLLEQHAQIALDRGGSLGQYCVTMFGTR